MKWHQSPAGKPDSAARINNTVKPITILKAEEKEGKAYLQIKFDRAFYEEIAAFLIQKGYALNAGDKTGIYLLIEFGLSDDSPEELEKIKQEMLKSSSRNAAMSFRTAQYYSNNQTIAIGLTVHLSENRRLKQELKEKGLGQYVAENEWDRWDDEYVDGLYKKYVFGK